MTWALWGTATGQGWVSQYGTRHDLFRLSRRGAIQFYVDYEPYPFRVYWRRLGAGPRPDQPEPEMA